MKDTSSKITIVVPFRNVAENGSDASHFFLQFLRSLNHISSAVHEVILVNDHSMMELVEPKENWVQQNWKWLSLKENEFGKKAALKLGIEEARTEYIWTLDADVLIENFSEENFGNFEIGLKEDLIILPVFMRSENSLLDILQSNEWRYLQFMTRLSAKLKMPMMCNGANLIFKRQVFLDKINSHEHISSGDDMFLLSEVLREKGSVSLNWERFCSVNISPSSTWRETLNQRVRWAGKTTKLPYTRSSFLHIAFALLSAIHAIAFVGLFQYSLHLICAEFLMLKVLLEVSCMYGIFKVRMNLREMVVAIPQMLLYPFFSLLIFISSLFFVPNWKGRRVSLK